VEVVWLLTPPAEYGRIEHKIKKLPTSHHHRNSVVGGGSVKDSGRASCMAGQGGGRLCLWSVMDRNREEPFWVQRLKEGQIVGVVVYSGREHR